MKGRVKFIGIHSQEEWTMAELCRHFDISRKTGYKTVRRFDQDGLSGLKDRLRAPHHDPNAVWSCDLKGWFLTGDGVRCDPLTISDNYSRMLFRGQAVTPTNHDAIQPVFEAAFCE